MNWYHDDGSPCRAGHTRPDGLCLEGGGVVTNAPDAVLALREELEEVRAKHVELTGRAEALELTTNALPEGGLIVYIPEAIIGDNNPWDSRRRYGVHTTLTGALAALSTVYADMPEDKPLVATKCGNRDRRTLGTFMVHHSDEQPRLDGELWIFVVRVEP